jgi:hypothetical protein
MLLHLVLHNFYHLCRWHRSLLQPSRPDHGRRWWNVRFHDGLVRYVLPQHSDSTPCHGRVPVRLCVLLRIFVARTVISMGYRALASIDPRSGKRDLDGRELARQLLRRHHMPAHVHQHQIPDLRRLRGDQLCHHPINLLLLP